MTILASAWLPQIAVSQEAEPDAIAAAPGLIPYQAEYNVRRNGKKIGELTATLSQDPNDASLWRYRLESEATDWLVRLLGISTLERSVFEWHEGHIRPLFYRMDSREPGTDRYWQHRYDWSAMQTSTDNHDGDLNIMLTADTLDPMTLRLAMALLRAPAENEDHQWSFNVLERDEIERQSIRLIDQSRIEVGRRCFATLQLYRFRREGSSRNYHAWHAPALYGLPVKVRHDDDDNIIEMHLTDWQFKDDAAPGADDFSCSRDNSVSQVLR